MSSPPTKFMAKYRKDNNDAKKIKQASKDYGTKSRSNIKENINRISSSAAKILMYGMMKQ